MSASQRKRMGEKAPQREEAGVAELASLVVAELDCFKKPCLSSDTALRNRRPGLSQGCVPGLCGVEHRVRNGKSLSSSRE